jgi:SAM-dependent methyltransferase
MRPALLDVLVCPACAGSLRASDDTGERALETGTLHCTRCPASYPVVRGIPRFVAASNYADNFGLQWNLFRRTQLDSHSGIPISYRRFVDQSGWTPEMLEGQRVLDVGCGAGRFAEIALSFGARVVALDYSSAVDACRANLGDHPRLDVVQGDIYALPFRRGAFPFVYCFGVLQHTPDVERAFKALPAVVAPGGALAVDLYAKNWQMWLHPRRWLRPITTRMNPERLFGLVRRVSPPLLTLSCAASRVPALGPYLKRFVPVANYAGVYPLSRQQLLEWAVLDTFDWLGPRYDQPQTASTLRQWFAETGLIDVQVFRSHHLTGRGRMPAEVSNAAGD